ncbi:MAG: nucleotidyl transferase AbiEii/AbiGii toxin family protein [Candidatus Woesearchaeota archaeon]
MITRTELVQIAKQKGLHLGQAEKNYLHFLLLEIISKELPDKLVFKGGTALMICHNLNRFSEDLDFAAINTDSNIIEKLKETLQKRIPTIEFELLEKTPVSESLIVRFQGPLYTGTRQTTSKIEIDISFREKIETKTDMKRIISPYPDIPTFFVQTMSLTEIFAEKIRAILTRNKARDVFDLEYLIALDVHTSKEGIEKKPPFFPQTY